MIAVRRWSCVLFLLMPLLASAQAAKSARQPHVAIIRKKIDAELESLVALYKQIHAHPELAFQEEQTAARLAKEMRTAGFMVTEKIGGTGVVGVLKNGVGPTILVRADMDALPIVEQTGVPYASKVRTRDKDGLDVGVMHACGHDLNVTSLIGTARVMAALKDRWARHAPLHHRAAGGGDRCCCSQRCSKTASFNKFPRLDFGLALHCDGRYPMGHVNYREGQLQANVDLGGHPGAGKAKPQGPGAPHANSHRSDCAGRTHHPRFANDRQPRTQSDRTRRRHGRRHPRRHQAQHHSRRSQDATDRANHERQGSQGGPRIDYANRQGCSNGRSRAGADHHASHRKLHAGVIQRSRTREEDGGPVQGCARPRARA